MKNILLMLLIIIISNIVKGNYEKDSLLNRYKVTVDSNDDIFIFDNQTNQKLNWGKVPNCYCNHYRFAEYHYPNLYIIRRFDTKKPDWNDELWVYSTVNKGKLLVKAQGLDFCVNDQQTLLSYYNLDTLIIVDLLSNQIRKIRISDDDNINKECYIESMKWDRKNDIIWGILSWSSASHYNFFSYDYKNNSLKKYDIPKGCDYDYDINADLGLLLFSDYPNTNEYEEAEYLIETKTKISLYLLDLKTNRKELIKTSIGKEFNPKWITNELFEFNSSEKDKREKMNYIK